MAAIAMVEVVFALTFALMQTVEETPSYLYMDLFVIAHV